MPQHQAVAVTPVTHYAADEEAAVGQYQAGDFVLVRSPYFFSKMIRYGQRLRFLGKNRRYTGWNHAALIVSDQGDLVEALGPGVVTTHLSHYKPTDYAVVSVSAISTDHDRRQAVAFAKRMVGRKYGVITALSMGLSLLLGWRLIFSLDRQFVCSGLVARCLERMDFQLESSPTHVKPADLALRFECPLDVKEKDWLVSALATMLYVAVLLVLVSIGVGLVVTFRYVWSLFGG